MFIHNPTDLLNIKCTSAQLRSDRQISTLLLWKTATMWQHFFMPPFFFFFLCNFLLILYCNRVDFQSCVCIWCTSVAETSTGESKHHTVGGWRTQFYYAGGPRGVNTPSSGLQNKGGLQFSYRHVVTQEGKSRQLRRVLECRNGKTRPFSSFPPLINGWNCITCLPSYPLGRRYLPYSSPHPA